MGNIQNGRPMIAVIDFAEVDIKDDTDTARNQYHSLVAMIVLAHQCSQFLVTQTLVHVRYLYSKLSIITCDHEWLR